MYILYMCVYLKCQHNLPITLLASLSVMLSYLVFISSRWGQLGMCRSLACSFFPYTTVTVCLFHSHLLLQINIMSSPFATLSFIFESRIKLAERVDSAVKCNWLTAFGLASPWAEFGKSKHKIVQGTLSTENLGRFDLIFRTMSYDNA